MHTKRLELILKPYNEHLRSYKPIYTLDDESKGLVFSLVLKRSSFALDCSKPKEYRAVQLANLFLDLYELYVPTKVFHVRLTKRYNTNIKRFMYPIPAHFIMKVIFNAYTMIENPKGVPETFNDILMMIRWLGIEPLEALDLAIRYRKEQYENSKKTIK